jgi:NADPH2:quinone reductase
VVEAVGGAVRRFRPGDAVYFCNGGIGGPPGTYAQYAVIDEAYAAPKPAALDFVSAAAAPLVVITAWESLYDRAKVRQGQTVLVHAAAGGVGHIAVQLAKLAGAWVCTTVGSAEKAQLARGLGADETILYREHDFVPVLLKWTEGDGVDIALDTVGGATFARTVFALRCYGDLVTLLAPDPKTDWQEVRKRNLRISFELMLSPMYYAMREQQRHQADILEQAGRLFDSGKLSVRIAHTLPLAEAAHAHRLIEQGSLSGKIVLTID